MKMELPEITDHDPARIHAVREKPGISPGLLKGGKHGTVGLAIGAIQVNIETFLLYQYSGLRDVGINKNG